MRSPFSIPAVQSGEAQGLGESGGPTRQGRSTLAVQAAVWHTLTVHWPAVLQQPLPPDEV